MVRKHRYKGYWYVVYVARSLQNVFPYSARCRTTPSRAIPTAGSKQRIRPYSLPQLNASTNSPSPSLPPFDSQPPSNVEAAPLRHQLLNLVEMFTKVHLLQWHSMTSLVPQLPQSHLLLPQPIIPFESHAYSRCVFHCKCSYYKLGR